MSLADSNRRSRRPVYHDDLSSSSSSAASSPNVVRAAKSSLSGNSTSRNAQSTKEHTFSASNRVMRGGSTEREPHNFDPQFSSRNCEQPPQSGNARCYYTLPIRESGGQEFRIQEQGEEPLYANLLPRHRLPPPVKPPRKLVSQFGPTVSRSNTVTCEDRGKNRGRHLHSRTDQSSREDGYRRQHRHSSIGQSSQNIDYRGPRSADDSEIEHRSMHYRLAESEEEYFNRNKDRISSSRSHTSLESGSPVKRVGDFGQPGECDKDHIRRELLLASRIFGLDGAPGNDPDDRAASRSAALPASDTRVRLSLSPVQQRRMVPSKRSVSELKRYSLQRSGSLGEFDMKPNRNLHRLAPEDGDQQTSQETAIRFDLRHYSPGELWEYIEIPNRFNERAVDVNVESADSGSIPPKANCKTSRIKINAKNKNSAHKSSKVDLELSRNGKANVKYVSKRTTQLFSDFLSLPRARASRNSGDDQYVALSDCDGKSKEMVSSNHEDQQFRLLPSDLYSSDVSPGGCRDRVNVGPEIFTDHHTPRSVLIDKSSRSKETAAKQFSRDHLVADLKTNPALGYSKTNRKNDREDLNIGIKSTNVFEKPDRKYQSTHLNDCETVQNRSEIGSNENDLTKRRDVDELEKRLNHTKLTNHHTNSLERSSENTSDYFKSSLYRDNVCADPNVSPSDQNTNIGPTTHKRNSANGQGYVINPLIKNRQISCDRSDQGRERILHNENCVRVIINGDIKSNEVANELSPASSTLPRLVHRSVTCISTGSALPRSRSLHTLRDQRPPPVTVKRHQLHRTNTMVAHGTPHPDQTLCPVTSPRPTPACRHGLGDHERRTDPSGASNSDSETEPSAAERREQKWAGREGRNRAAASSGTRAADSMGDAVSMASVAGQGGVIKDATDNSGKHPVGGSEFFGGGNADNARDSGGVRTSDVVDYFERLNQCNNSVNAGHIPSNRLLHKQLRQSGNNSAIDHISASAVKESGKMESENVCSDLKLAKTKQYVENYLSLETVNDSFSDAEYGEYNLIDATTRYEEKLSDQRLSMTSSNCGNNDLLFASENVVESDHESLNSFDYKTPVFSAIVDNNACLHERVNIENKAMLMEPLDRNTADKTCSVPNADNLPDSLAREQCVRHSAELQRSSESEAEVCGALAGSSVCAGQVANSEYVSQQPLSGFSIDQEVSTMNAVAASVHSVNSRAMRARKSSDTDTDGVLSGLVTDSGVEIDSLSIDSGSAKSVIPSAAGEESPSMEINGKRCHSALKSSCENDEKRVCIDNSAEGRSSMIEAITNSNGNIQHSEVSNSSSDYTESVLYDNNVSCLSHEEKDIHNSTENLIYDSNTQLESDESSQPDNFQGIKSDLSHVGNFVRVISVGDDENSSNLSDQCPDDCGNIISERTDLANESAEVEVVMGDKTKSFMVETAMTNRSLKPERSQSDLRSLVARSREAQKMLQGDTEIGKNTGLAGYYAGLDAPVLSSSSRAQPRTPEIRRHQRDPSPEECSSHTDSELRPNTSSDIRSEYSDEPPDDFHDGFDFGSEDSYRNERYDSDDYNSTEDRESNYTDNFSDEFYSDEEPRFARPIDFTLTTIIEESCEDSDCDARSNSEVERSNPSQLEKYFFFDLGNGPHDTRKYANGESECSDAYSETSESVYSELVDGDRSIEGPFSHSSLQYFRKGFLGLNRQSSIRSVGDDSENQSDGSGSVGSDSESQHSPEQRRKKVSRFRFRTQSELSCNSIDQTPRDLADSCSYVSSEDDTEKIDISDDTTTCDKSKDSCENVKYRKKKKANFSEEGSDKEHASENIQMEITTDHCSPKKQQADIELSKSIQLNQLSESVEVSTSRDSGFLGSSDDLLKEAQSKLSDSSKSTVGGCNSNLNIDGDVKINDLSETKSLHDKNISSPCDMPSKQSRIQNKGITRTDSFNNWSSDEETNILMGRLRQVFRSTTINTGHKNGPSDCAAKPPFLVNFENALRRMMRSVPGINEEQVREIVEYLSSEENWSDSNDSSDHTSSDIEGANAFINAKYDLSNLHETNCFDVLNGSQSHMNVLNNETDVLCQKLVARLKDLRNSPKYSSPPLLSKVFDHIGDRLATLMREVVSSDSTSNSDYSPNFSDGRPQKNSSSSDFMSASPNSHGTSQISAERLADNSVRLSKPSAASDDNILATCEQVKSSDNLAKSPEGKDSIDFNKILRDSKRKKKKEFESCHNLLEKDRKNDKESKLNFTKDKWARLNGRVKSEGDVSEKSLGSNSTLIIGRPLSSEFSSSDQMDSDSTLKAADSYDRQIDQNVVSRRLVSGDIGMFNGNDSSNTSLRNDTAVDKPGISDTESDSDKRLWHVANCQNRSSVTSASDLELFSTQRNGTIDGIKGSVPDIRSTLPRSAVSGVTGGSSRPQAANLHPAGTRSLPRSRMTTSHKGTVLMGVSSLATDSSRSARYRPPGFRPSQTVNELRTVSLVSRPLPATDGKASGIRSSDPSLISDRGLFTARPHYSELDTEHANLDRDSSQRQGSAQGSALGSRSSSLASVCSSSGGDSTRFSSVVVRGDVQLAISYCPTSSTLEVHVKQCRELAAVDSKRARSDPYVKLYLLPDCTKGGKRKTKTRKHTLSPVFDEVLKFGVAFGELSNRTLWLSVWHCDMFGRNEFLGELRLPVSSQLLETTGFHWYQLQERSGVVEESSSSHGTIVVALKFAPPEDEVTHRRTKKTHGSLFIMVKEARNLASVKGHVDSFCKSFLLPDRKTSKQKTAVVRRSCSPHWGCTLVYPHLSLEDLRLRGVELSVWDHGLATSEFLGGVRLNLGTGESGGIPALWMDAAGDEVSLWQDMLQRPGFWVEQALPLRPAMERYSINSREN